MNGKAIFWDFDGTLVQSNQSFADSLQKAFTGHHITVDRSAIADFLKSSCSWYDPAREYPDCTGEGWWQTLLEKLDGFCQKQHVPPEFISDILAAFRENVIYFPYCLYPDAKEILEYSLRKGYRNYLLSNNFPELRQVLKAYGLQDLFSGIFLSAELGYEKPNRKLFDLALNLAGNPDHAFMVGDNPIADIEGGAAAGLTSILVHREGICPAADYQVSQLQELKPIL